MIDDQLNETPEAVPALSISQLSKTYSGTRALSDVSLTVNRGEIRALVGGNGSGKSTLIKTLAGVVEPDAGASYSVFGSASQSKLTPSQAFDLGLRFVHQDPCVFDDLTVAENLALGSSFATAKSGHISRPRLRAWARTLTEKFGIDASVNARVGSLGQGTKTMISIARALGDDLADSRRILVLDEATAALSEKECDAVFDVVRTAAKLGHAVIFVTHRLEEVLTMADQATVLRDGVLKGTMSTVGLTEDELIASMLGRRIGKVFPAMPEVIGDNVLLSVDGLAAGPLQNVSFELRQGEVLGVAGILGSGRSSLLRSIFGDLPARAGTMRLAGERHAPSRPADAMTSGIAYVPEERLLDAAYSDMSVSTNLQAASPTQFFTGLRFSRKKEERANAQLVRDFSVKTTSLATSLSLLSGGNQQKVILARWMRRNPRLLLLDEPTQGVDVGARADIYELIRTSVDAGAAAIIVASDFEELARVSDRVIVIRHGVVSNVVDRASLSAELLEELAHSSRNNREVMAGVESEIS